MSTPNTPSTSDMWAVISKEITGIQLLWEAVEQVYFKTTSRPGIDVLAGDVPTLYRLIQTAMMESLLMRTARLMDPSVSGKGLGEKKNLSLARLVNLEEILKVAFEDLKMQWSASSLRAVRDKYLSHNDLGRSQTEEHTLNIPLTDEGVAAVGEMVSALRSFRVVASKKISGCAYVDASVSLQIERECDTLDRLLRAGDVFFNLLPEHAFLQEAWTDKEATGAERNKPC